MRWFSPSLLVSCAVAGAMHLAAAQERPVTPPPIAVPAVAVHVNDPAAATRAWLDSVPAEKRAQSDAYFQGGYWLLLWNFLVSATISILLLQSRVSARLREFAERRSRFWIVQVALYALASIILAALLSFPLTYYELFVREHAYGMATQNFGQWFGEQLKALLLSLIADSLFVIALYGVIRRAPRTWWLWGTGVALLFLVIGFLISPVYIEPIFNTYKPITDPAISTPILELARANKIPVTQVFEVDASRQTKRISANVAGFLGTTRIALNDNLLRECTLAEIRHVMGHEMGHYVLNHVAKLIAWFGLFTFLSFAVARAAYGFAVRRWGERWGVRGISDVAGLPLLVLIFSTVIFLLTPVIKTATRISEVEADAFGLKTAQEPDGMAAVSLKLGAYRKLDPGPIEEFIFFDHPSGRARIRMAMDWKVAHQGEMAPRAQ